MNKSLKKTTLAKCILLALFATSSSALAKTTNNSTPCAAGQTTTCGLRESTDQTGKGTLFVDGANGSAVMAEATNSSAIYMYDRKTAEDTESLVVSGTDMSGTYIHGGYNGTANITLQNNAATDMIEAGNTGATTNINILVDHATLKGQQANTAYGTYAKPGDKNYMMGAAIYIDAMDAGDHNISIVNGSQLNGSVFTAGSGANNVSVADSAINTGAIMAGSYKADASVTLTDSTLDATNNQAAQTADADITRIINVFNKLSGKDIVIDPALLDNTIAVGVYGTQNTRVALDNSRVTGDVAVMNDGGASAVSLSNHSQLDGDIMLAGAGAAQVTVNASTLNGAINGSGEQGDTTYGVQNGATVNGDITTGGGNATVTLTDSHVIGNVVMANDANFSQINASNSQLDGNIVLSGNSAVQMTIDNSTVNGRIDGSGEQGDTTVLVQNHSTVNGDITTGSGNDQVVLASDSHVSGNINGGAGADVLSMDESSSLSGQMMGFETVNTTGDNDINIDTVQDNNRFTLVNGSTLTAGSMGSNTQIVMSSDSRFAIGTVAGQNNQVVVSEITPSTQGQSGVVLGTFGIANPSSALLKAAPSVPVSVQQAVNVNFANGEQQVANRNGAWNYSNEIVISADAQQTTPNITTYSAVLNSDRHELASDVQGMIAGLDAAKQSSHAMADDLFSRLDTLYASNLYNGVQEGARVWGDFLYQNGDYSDDVEYKNVMQGMQGGVDWTTTLDNGDAMTAGIALGYARNRTQSNSGGENNFRNTVYGNFYSLYGGWQQALHERNWGLFADGVVMYGDMRYNMSANNVTGATTGMTEALSASYDGASMLTELRGGMNIMLADTLVQPYVTLGWDKSESDAFDDSEIHMNDGKVSAMNTSVGVRATAHLLDVGKSVQLMPWLDARYQTEFNDDTDLKAADYHSTSGHNQKAGIFGAGMTATVNKNVSFNAGVYYGTGDVDNDASVQAGLSMRF